MLAPAAAIALAVFAASAEPSASSRRLRAAADEGVYLGVGFLTYLVDWNNPQRRFPISTQTLREKFVTRTLLQLDANVYGVNTPGHAVAGLMYYLAARTHRLSPAESLLYSAGTSLLWETAIEFREELSINDLIITPSGGMALAEPLYQFGELFRRSDGRLPYRIAGALLRGPNGFFPWYGEPASTAAPGLDGLGLPADLPRRFEMGVGAQASRERAWAVLFFDARISRAIDPDQPLAWAGRPLDSAVQARGFIGSGGLEEFRLVSTTTWSGLRAAGHGFTFFAGPNAVFELDRASSRRGGDRLSATSPLGVAAQLAWQGSAVRAAFDASLHPAFAALDNHAWTPAIGVQPPRALEAHGYYFATGFRAAASLEVAGHGWSLFAGARAYELSPAEWLQVRAIRSPLSLHDERFDAAAGLALQLPWAGLWSALTLERSWRHSAAETLQEDAAFDRAAIDLRWRL